MAYMDCRSCGVSLEKTGRAGRPPERCAACRVTRYAFSVCQRCGERLPEKRNKHSRFCDKRCQNSAWVEADRAARKATDPEY